jgi:hypothetical protein
VLKWKNLITSSKLFKHNLCNKCAPAAIKLPWWKMKIISWSKTWMRLQTKRIRLFNKEIIDSLNYKNFMSRWTSCRTILKSLIINSLMKKDELTCSQKKQKGRSWKAVWINRTKNSHQYVKRARLIQGLLVETILS